MPEIQIVKKEREEYGGVIISPTGDALLPKDTDIVEYTRFEKIKLGNLGVGTNYILVYANGSPSENAYELQSAYNSAKLKYPTLLNRIKIFILPGIFIFDSVFILDTPYVDISSISGYPDVYINGIDVQADEINILGLNCGSSVFTIGNNLPNVIVEKCISNGRGSFCVSPLSEPGSSDIVASTFIDCVSSSTNRCFGGYEITSGKFIRCKATSSSSEAFSRGNIAAGIYIDCEANKSSFGGSNASYDFFLGKATGYFERCKCLNSTGHPFGFAEASGVFKYCEASVDTSAFQPLQISYAVGSVLTKCAGTFINCIAGPGSFGGSFDTDGYCLFDGFAFNCIGGLGSFGSKTSTGGVSGTIINCIIRNSLAARNGWVDNNSSPLFPDLELYDCTINGAEITCTSNELSYGRKIKFDAVNLPLELDVDTTYFIVGYDYLTNKFGVSLTYNGSPIVTSGESAECKLNKGAIINCIDGTNTLINKLI